MKHLRKIFLPFFVTLMLVIPRPSYSFWGNPADTATLLKILANSLQQLIQLRNIVNNAQYQLSTIRDINSGLVSILNLTNTIYPNRGLSLYRSWLHVAQSKGDLEAIYGAVVASKDALPQKHLDESVVDSVILNNETLNHSQKVDHIGESIKSQSMEASPKGAARLTAQGVGVGLHVQNQSLRIQSAHLKLQAQNIANQNRLEKESTRFFLKSSKELKRAMRDQKTPYKTPRF